MEAIRTIGRHGVEINEYKGEISLVACYEGKDGKFYQQWGKQKVGKDSYSETDRPVKVVLGDKATAVNVLKMLIKQIDGKDD